MNEDKLVFRQLAIPVRTFDYLKEWQRAYEERHGVKLTNSQILTVMLAEHRTLTNTR